MNNQKYNIHGFVSTLLIFISFGIGIASIAYYSIWLSIVSLFTIVMSFLIISVFYCSKCKCRDKCNHLILGKISILFTKSNPGKYTFNNLIAGVIVPMLIVIALPQYWLFKQPVLLISYWIIFAFAGLEIYFFICTRCLNDKCSMCRNKHND